MPEAEHVGVPVSRVERLRLLLHRASPFVGLALFALALWVLHDWSREQHHRQVRASLAAVSSATLLHAGVLTVGAYAVLVGYDLLALRHIGRRVAPASVATAAFVSNALGNNFGNTLITGAAVRFWSYTAAGLSASEITRVVIFCSVGFWLGFLLVGGISFVLAPLPLPESWHIALRTTQPLGWLLVLLLVLYLAKVAWSRSMSLGSWQVQFPTLALSLGQIAVAALDLCMAAAVFHALLPEAAHVGFVQCLAIYLVALLVGNLSLVPGGLGVFETAAVLLLSPRVTGADLAVALLLFRALYYVAPLFVAVALLGLRAGAGLVPILRGHFARGRRSAMSLAPQVMAGAVFVAGAVLLFSGAVPAAAGRLDPLHRVLALPMIEASHFLASLVGAALLLLAHGLQRRLDAAWLLALLLLAAGALLSLGKGWDFEEATLLALAAVGVAASRGQFYRKSSMLGEPLSIPWLTAGATVTIASLWLVWFSHRHALETGQPWWSFALHAQASRSLRATVAAAALIGLAAGYRLLRPLRPAIGSADADDIERARPLVERSPATYANLALRGDKALLFSNAGDAFLMYGRHGRTWVAMGDPVGSAAGSRELRWRFRELCDRFDGWCAFFHVLQERHADYAELGLGFTPVGEQARVDLAGFVLDGPAHRDLRQTRAKLMRNGCEFAIIPRDAVAELLPTLERISMAWLAGKAAHEKGFSNASYSADYVRQFPVAVVRCRGEAVAFANLWLGAGKQELSVDLMRHLPSAPNGTMDYLFTELLLWGRAQGYRWFDFGMAPLAGLDAQREAPLWGSVGTLLYRHGEHFYNFEGLRHFKAKFSPAWAPLYLASPGGLALPAILIDVSALIAGSLTGIVSRGGPQTNRSGGSASPPFGRSPAPSSRDQPRVHAPADPGQCG